jgi:ribosomal protein S12 methylthiotransferase accessory factor
MRHSHKKVDSTEFSRHTPLIFARWALDRASPGHLFWTGVFVKNTYNHEPLPSPSEIKFPIPFDLDDINPHSKDIVHIREICSQTDKARITPWISTRERTAAETVQNVLRRLSSIDLVLGTERESAWSLSPYALERSWRTEVQVAAGRNRWRLAIPQTSYGKGLEEDQARASYLMEIVERYSSFASFSHDSTIGYKNEFRIVRSSYTDLVKQGLSVLNPNTMNLEVPYEDQVLYWITGRETGTDKDTEIYLPTQFVFLFCNLDEVSLTSGVSSNGLAAGNTEDEARLHALMEYIERDADRVGLYSPERCFTLEAEDPTVAHLLNRCRETGRHVQFLDLTTDLGIPCYKAFIKTGDEFVRGCAADLSGKTAAVSALTELAYPYFVRSNPPPAGQRTIKYEDLPDYSSGDVIRDLNTVEKLLLSNGLKPIYVDLTRKDLDIPVVRAFVPGLEFMTILDRFSNLSKRQFRNYLKTFGVT